MLSPGTLKDFLVFPLFNVFTGRDANPRFLALTIRLYFHVIDSIFILANPIGKIYKDTGPCYQFSFAMGYQLLTAL